MRKHTPGPWEVIEHNGPISIYGPEGERVARMGWMDEKEGGQSTKLANAHLVASAPKLLKALEQLVLSHSPDANFPAINNARAAIDQALGKS